jgi:hypothetical protein
MPDESILGLPCPNPHFVRRGLSEEFPPTGAHWGYWADAISYEDNRLNYWKWVEIPKQDSLREPLTVVTPSGVRLKNPA